MSVTPPIYASDSGSPEEQPASKKLKTSVQTDQIQEKEIKEAGLSDHPTKGCISYQVKT